MADDEKRKTSEEVFTELSNLSQLLLKIADQNAAVLNPEQKGLILLLNARILEATSSIDASGSLKLVLCTCVFATSLAAIFQHVSVEGLAAGKPAGPTLVQ
jgi:hypothetical protein